MYRRVRTRIQNHGGGWSSDQSCRRGRDRERKRHLNWKILWAALKAGAANASCQRFSVVALPSAVMVQDRRKESGVLCEYEAIEVKEETWTKRDKRASPLCILQALP